MRARLKLAAVTVTTAAAALAGGVAGAGAANAADGRDAWTQGGDPCSVQDVHVLDMPVKAVNRVCTIKHHLVSDVAGVIG